MTKSIENRIEAIAKKVPCGSKEEKLEIAKQLNLLAELLIGLKEINDGKCSSVH